MAHVGPGVDRWRNAVAIVAGCAAPRSPDVGFIQSWTPCVATVGMASTEASDADEAARRAPPWAGTTAAARAPACRSRDRVRVAVSTRRANRSTPTRDRRPAVAARAELVVSRCGGPHLQAVQIDQRRVATVGRRDGDGGLDAELDGEHLLAVRVDFDAAQDVEELDGDASPFQGLMDGGDDRVAGAGVHPPEHCAAGSEEQSQQHAQPGAGLEVGGADRRR